MIKEMKRIKEPEEAPKEVLPGDDHVAKDDDLALVHGEPEKNDEGLGHNVDESDKHVETKVLGDDTPKEGGSYGPKEDLAKESEDEVLKDGVVPEMHTVMATASVPELKDRKIKDDIIDFRVPEPNANGFEKYLQMCACAGRETQKDFIDSQKWFLRRVRCV